MILLGLLLLVGVVHVFDPKTAEKAVWVIAAATVLPLVTYVAGTLSWVVVTLLADDWADSASTWLACCLLVGLPAGVLSSLALRRRIPSD